MADFPVDSEIDYANDTYFSDRGIDANVAAARGYRSYDETNYMAVMEAVYDGYPDYVMNWAIWAARQCEGITVPRFSPPGFDEISPGLKFHGEIRNGAPQRHYHGREVDVMSLLPSAVELAYAVPQKFGRVKVRFEHSHADLTEAELTEHREVFHAPAGKMPKKSHAHTFYVIPESQARSHIGGSTKADAHGGENPQKVHVHQKKAKCVYTPSSKKAKHMGFDHDHDEMNAKQLAYHLDHYHQEEEEGP